MVDVPREVSVPQEVSILPDELREDPFERLMIFFESFLAEEIRSRLFSRTTGFSGAILSDEEAAGIRSEEEAAGIRSEEEDLVVVDSSLLDLTVCLMMKSSTVRVPEPEASRRPPVQSSDLTV